MLWPAVHEKAAADGTSVMVDILSSIGNRLTVRLALGGMPEAKIETSAIRRGRVLGIVDSQHIH